MTEPLYHWTACQIADAVRARQVSASAVVGQVLERIAAIDPVIRAYAVVDADGARAAAAALDARIQAGEDVGPLAGVPFSVKDLVATRGVETSFGSHVFADNVPTKDAVAVARMREAGAILLGKTTTPEFGHKALTSSPRYGHTRNPWALDRSPGGSSGGSAAAVAAALGPLSLTTDGSGSSRIPASACGVLGLKPTQGLIPHENAVELFTNFITLGLAARTADDLALALSATAGADAGDPWSRSVPQRHYELAAEPLARVRGLRVRVIEKMGNRRMAEVVRLRLQALVAALQEHGARRVDKPDPDMDWGGKTMLAMMRAYQQHRLQEMGRKHEKVIDPSLLDALREGAAQQLADVQRAASDRAQLYRRVEALFEDADVLLTPTVSAPPPRVDHRQDEDFEIDGEVVGRLRQQWYCYTGAFNLTGHPAISIPIGFDEAGLPIGAQIVGPWFSEALLLDLAGAVEQLMPWRDVRPSVPTDAAAGGYLAYPAVGANQA